MWIEPRGRQHRVYWRTGLAAPKKAFEPFASREKAELFIKLARMSSLEGALAFVRDPAPDPDALRVLLGQPPATAEPRPAEPAIVGVTGADPDALDRVDARVGVTFKELWDRYVAQQRQLEGSTLDLYEGYGVNHLLPFFGSHDLGLIQRTRPLQASRALPGAIYVDDWVELMLAKPRMNNVQRPIPGSKLSVKFVKNVQTFLAQVFQMAVDERPSLLEVNPAHNVKLPKQDQREMQFLEDASAYLDLRTHMPEHFRPVLDFLVGTGARFGEAAGLLVRNLHLDVERPYVDIRLVLKWSRKRRILGRPKTASSRRRITLSPRLVEILRPLVEGKDSEHPVFTMLNGGPLHHGNFTSRYFKPAVQVAGARVPDELRIHDLRHTHATWLLSDGAPIHTVQRRLGHSTMTTTVEVYGHITSESDDRTLAMVDRRLPDFVTGDDGGAEVLSMSVQERDLPEIDVDDKDDVAA